jgi:cytochrome c oxidase subunit 1
MLNKNLGYIHFLVTAICAYGVFSNAFYRFSRFAEALLHQHNFPLFDDYRMLMLMITFAPGAFQLIFLYNFSVVYSTERNPWNLIPSNGLHL